MRVKQLACKIGIQFESSDERLHEMYLGLYPSLSLCAWICTACVCVSTNLSRNLIRPPVYDDPWPWSAWRKVEIITPVHLREREGWRSSRERH